MTQLVQTVLELHNTNCVWAKYSGIKVVGPPHEKQAHSITVLSFLQQKRTMPPNKNLENLAAFK